MEYWLCPIHGTSPRLSAGSRSNYYYLGQYSATKDGCVRRLTVIKSWSSRRRDGVAWRDFVAFL